MIKQLLDTRLSIIMVRENMTFLNTFREFQIQLNKYFNAEYTLDEIETSLHNMEEAFICEKANEEKQIQIVLLEEMEEN